MEQNEMKIVSAIKLPDYKSKIIIGNMEIQNTKHFNKLNKFMFKYLFGVKIEDIEEKNK